MSTVRAVLVPVEGEIRDVEIDPNDYRSWANAIGSQWVEVVRTADRFHRLIVDEEGRLTGKPVNPRASVLYSPGLMGDVLLVGWNEQATYSDDEDEPEIVDCGVEPSLFGDWAVERGR